MLVEFKPKNIKIAQKMFSTEKRIVVLLEHDHIYFYSQSAPLLQKLSYHQLRYSSEEIPIPISFGIDKSILSSFTDALVVRIEIEEQEISISLLSPLRESNKEKVVATFIIQQHPVSVLSVSSMVHEMVDSLQYPTVPLVQLNRLSNLCQKSNMPIVINEGYAYIEYLGYHILQKVDLPDCSIFPVPLKMLLAAQGYTDDGYVESIYHMKEFFVYVNKNVGIKLEKAGFPMNLEIDMYRRMKYKSKYTIDIDNLKLLRFTGKGITEFIMDLQNYNIVVCMENEKRIIPVTVREDKTTDTSDIFSKVLPKITLPPGLLSDIILPMKNKEITLLYSSKFFRLDIGGITFIGGL